MRARKPLSLATLVVGVAALGLELMGGDAVGTCTGHGTCLAARLPTPITITTGAVSYRIARDGRATRIANAVSRYPRDAAWFPGTDTWYVVRHGQLVVGRGSTTLWRSRREIPAGQLGVIAAGPHAVAFQHDHVLFIAAYGGTDRPVARREVPLGWSAGGLFTYSYTRRELLLRSDTGAILETIARRPLQYEYDLGSGSLFFVTRGVLVGARGARAWRLASLRSLGFTTNTWLQPMGRLVELMDDRRLVVLQPGGSVFASGPLPRDGRQPDAPSSSLAIAPSASAVAFTVAFGRTDNPSATRRAHGTEIAYLLHAGARAATALHVERVAFAPCERGASLQWHGSWLLYTNTEGNLAAIDTAGAHPTIELTGLVRRLLGSQHTIDANWSP